MVKTGRGQKWAWPIKKNWPSCPNDLVSYKLAISVEKLLFTNTANGS